jgi:hypothetical protein
MTLMKMGVFNPVVRTFLRAISPVWKPGAREKVVLFHGGRSGSTVLAGMLHAHPAIYWAGEVLSTHRLRRKYHPGFDYKSYMNREQFASFRRIYGMEVLFGDLKNIDDTIDRFVPYLKQTGYTYFILLKRNNSLRRIVSLEVAKQTKVYHVRQDMTAQMIQVQLNTQTLLSRFEREKMEFDRLRNLLQQTDYLELTYEEDIESDPAVAYGKVCAFLNVEPRDVKPLLKKINPYPLEEMIANYDEVASLLKGTQYAWMLDS